MNWSGRTIEYLVAGFVLFLGTSIGAAQMRPSTSQPERPGSLGQDEKQPAPGEVRGGSGQELQAEAEAKVDDATLQREVHEQLAGHGDLANVQVKVSDGVVHLEGSVPRKENRKEARKVAESIPGVRGVKEKLTVNLNAAAASTTGAETSWTNPITSGSTTTAAQNPGSGISTPTLPGSSDANANAGALGQTQPSPTGNMPANPQATEQARREIQSALQANPALGGVNAAVSDNHVILSGSVPDDQEEQQALSLAQAHAAGRTVFNRMAVVPAIAGTGTSGAGGIAGAAANQTASNAPTAGTSGSVGTHSEAANNAAGSASESDIGLQIQRALRNEPTLASDDLKASVTEQKIVLTGSVSSAQEKQTAERIAASLAQGRQVENRVVVGSR